MTNILSYRFSHLDLVVKIGWAVVLFFVGLFLMFYGFHEVDYHKYEGAFFVFLFEGIALWGLGTFFLVEKGTTITSFGYLVAVLGNTALTWIYWHVLNQFPPPREWAFLLIYAWMFPFTFLNVSIWCLWGPKTPHKTSPAGQSK